MSWDLGVPDVVEGRLTTEVSRLLIQQPSLGAVTDSITKSGNRRLRTELVELAWRLILFQPNYYLVQKWKHVLLNPKAHARARKRAIVAFARQLLVDLWRWKTGRRTAEQLGWVMTAG